jgi:hypothetical protein
MMQLVRTTVTIDDELLKELKTIAAREDRTIGSLLEDALRDHLNRLAERQAPFTPLPRFTPADPGLRPGVDLEDRHAIMDLLDGIEPTA